VGLRLSGAAWYDSVYNKSNDNDSPFTNNATSVPNDRFTDETRELHGRDAELLDAFVFGNFDLGGMRAPTCGPASTRWCMARPCSSAPTASPTPRGPSTWLKLLTVPSSQFKEVLRPVPQVSGTLQIRPGLSLGAYYQFRWDETKIPGVGSYLSNIDWAGDGTESLIAGPGVIWNQVDAVNPDDQGQGGMQLRWSPEGSDFEYGLYFARYHAKTPSSFYFDPVGQTIRTVYGQDIRTYGVSATTSIGQLNLAAEASVRHNAPLNSDPQLVFYALGDTGDNDRNVRYAVGRTAHANLSGIYVLQPAALWDGGAFLFELAWNRVLSVSKNPAALDPNTTRDAWAMRMIFSPAYFQVLPGLDSRCPSAWATTSADAPGDRQLQRRRLPRRRLQPWRERHLSAGVEDGGELRALLGDEFSFVTPQKQPRADAFLQANAQGPQFHLLLHPADLLRNTERDP